MLLLLLFISNFLIISVSTLPQTGTNDQALSFKDIYSSNIKGFSNDFGKTRLISADDSTVKNDNIANPFVAYDSHASIDEVDLSNPSDDLADRPTDLVSTDVASQKSPNCKSDLATRDEMDDSISGDSLGPISSKMRLTHKTRSGVPDSQCIPLEQEQSPPTATSERPKRKGNPPQGESVKREGWQQPNGQFEDRHKCMDGFGVVCCKNPITPVYFTGWTRLLGNSENCVWYPNDLCDNGWDEICCKRIARFYNPEDITSFTDRGIFCLPILTDRHGYKFKLRYPSLPKLPD